MSSSSAPSGTITPTITPGLDALLHRAAYAPIQNVGWIRVTGSDRVRWLNGMVTNNIAALKPGEGNYNFFLNAQGRIQGDCTAWMEFDSILLETAADRIPALMALLDHFIIMDDVELQILDDRSGLLFVGPEVSSHSSLLSFRSAAKESAFVLPSANAMAAAIWNGANVDTLSGDSPFVPHLELWSDPATIASLSEALASTGIPQATTEDLETLRILSGTPRYGTDIRNSETAKDLPQETNQTRALHFAKGCYLGQEIVERIRSRGQVHRTFTGFHVEGDLPLPGTPLTDENAKTVGELTSVAQIGPQIYALGYIRREAAERPGARIQYPGGTVIPSALPFPISL